MASDWMNCATDVKTLAVASHADFTTSNVRIQKVPWDRPTLSTGGVILSSGTQKRSPATNKKTELEHTVVVTALIGSNQAHDDATELARLLSWRQTLRNAIIGNTLATGGAYDTMIAPGTVVIDGAFRGMFDATQFSVRCRVRG